MSRETVSQPAGQPRAGEFRQGVEDALRRRVLTYHSQVVFDPDTSFGIFVLEPEPDSGH